MIYGNECNQVKSMLKELKEKYANFDQELKEQEKLKEEMRLQIKDLDKLVEQQKADIKKLQMQLQDRESQIGQHKSENEEIRKENVELQDKLKSKTNLIKEYEADFISMQLINNKILSNLTMNWLINNLIIDIERERQQKRELEKQLKDLKASHESSSVLIKTSQSSQDELKQKLFDQAKKISSLEIDLERKTEECKKIELELNEQKDLFKRGAGDLQKDLQFKKDQIIMLEKRLLGMEQDMIGLQRVIENLQNDKKSRDLQIQELMETINAKELQNQLLLKQNENTLGDKDTQLNQQRQEYLTAINTQKQDLQQLRAQLKAKDQDNQILTEKISSLESHIHNIQSQNSDLGEFQKNTQTQIDNLTGENSSLKIQVSNLNNKITDLQQELSTLLKAQLDKEMQSFKTLQNQKSEQNVKMEQMTKDKRSMEAEISQLRQEKKDLQKDVQESEKKQNHTYSNLTPIFMNFYSRLEDAMKKIGQLEKDLEMQDEVLKKRHTQINELLKENTGYKNQIDNIRRMYGDLDEIETRLKIATLKEEKINSLLSKLDHVMSSTENNLSCYSCMALLTDPVILVPCGHTCCKKCLVGNTCQECDKSAKAMVPSKLIGDLVNKYQFKKDAIQTFKNESVWKNIIDSKQQQ